MKQKFKIVAMLMVIMVCSVLFASCSFLNFIPKPSAPSVYTTPIQTNPSLSKEERERLIAQTHVEAVVTIFVVEKSTDTEISFGSGVAIAKNGFIVTNYHVVQNVIVNSNVYKLEIYLNDNLTAYDGSVLWSNSTLDLAIVKCEYENIPFVPMKDRFIYPAENNALYALETVIAIGTPIDFSLQNTITKGEIASAKARLSTSGGNLYEHLIQHTSAINHGNSGGALFDTYGYLIGLNTLGHDDAHSIFFAVPIYPIMIIIDRVVDAYSHNKTFAYGVLGVTAYDRHQAQISGKNFDQTGVMVESVAPNGASFNKLQTGDIIKKIIVGDKTFEIDVRNNLIYALMHTDAGDMVTVEYQRGIFTNTAVITLK